MKTSTKWCMGGGLAGLALGVTLVLGTASYLYYNNQLALVSTKIFEAHQRGLSSWNGAFDCKVVLFKTSERTTVMVFGESKSGLVKGGYMHMVHQMYGGFYLSAPVKWAARFSPLTMSDPAPPYAAADTCRSGAIEHNVDLLTIVDN